MTLPFPCSGGRGLREAKNILDLPNVENRWFWIYKYQKGMICVVVCVSLSRVISTERSIFWSWCALLCRLLPKSTFATVGLQLLAERVHMSMMDLHDEGKPPSPGTTCLQLFGFSMLIHRYIYMYRCTADSWYYAWLPGVISSGSCHSCQELKDSTKMCWASMKMLIGCSFLCFRHSNLEHDINEANEVNVQPTHHIRTYSHQATKHNLLI